jgi:VanZ family protein
LLKLLQEKKVLLVYIPLVLYWIILLSATSIPSDGIPTTAVSDKVMHFTAYFGLGVLLNLTFIFQNKFSFLKYKSAAATIIIGSIYGGLDEFHQHFIPGRSMEFLDFVADFAGLVLAVVFVILLMKLNNFVPEETKV